MTTATPGPKPRVLVVDDDKAVRESLRRSLEFNGYDVALASDGAEALAQIAASAPDVVVMDVMMPRLNGIEATRALRSARNDVPILVLTARGGTPLARGLKQRHLSMIALGGVIGAGLFVGSGAGIAAAGPSIVLAYALSGVLVMLVMRMLGEMSAANPASGSFSVHAERAIGPWAGFTAGWMFWTLLCVGVAAEAIGAQPALKWRPCQG